MKRIYLILPILFESISEGLELREINIFKQLGKQVETRELFSWFLIFVIFGWEMLTRKASTTWKQYLRIVFGYVLVYVLLRIVFFNYAHNIAADLPLNYIGTVSLIDQLITIVGIIPYYILQGLSLIGVYFLIRK